MGEIEFLKSKNVTKTSQSDNYQELPKYLEADFINERINQIKNNRHRMLVIFLWMTGVRIQECLLVRKKDLDFINETIQIRWQKSKKYKYRNIPMHHKLKQVLTFYTASFKAEDKLFPFTRQNARKITMRYLHSSPHKLRHSFAVHYLRQGGELINLHKLLGHSRIQTTMIYLNIVPKDIGKELNKIEF